MVQLVRTTAIEGDWEKAARALRKLMLQAKDSTLVQDSYLLFNVAGRVDGVHWVVTFESMADEEKWGESVVNDETYIEQLMALRSEVAPMVDRLYRSVDFAWTDS